MIDRDRRFTEKTDQKMPCPLKLYGPTMFVGLFFSIRNLKKNNNNNKEASFPLNFLLKVIEKFQLILFMFVAKNKSF